jgi:protease IV
MCKGSFMEYQQDNNSYNPNQPGSMNSFQCPLSGKIPPEPRQKSIFKMFWGLVSAFSTLAGILFFLILAGLIIAVFRGQGFSLYEEVVIESPAKEKIALVKVDGILYEEQAQNVQQQLKAARQDNQVKAVIVQINSPGGTITASDQIHYEISKFRKNKSSIPVIAFMQGTAASGGYYSAVACEKIIAEPTTITGSIGVISEYFVFQDLLEEKLGIQPVVIKSGQKKDWPSSYRKPTDTELQYIQDRLIAPAIAQFKKVVSDGRKHVLTPEDVNNLADGGIFDATEAVKVKLIDQTGYLDDAVKLVKSMAGLKDAQVVQYRKPFSFSDILSIRTQNLPVFNRATLYELGKPELLYLWRGY